MDLKRYGMEIERSDSRQRSWLHLGRSLLLPISGRCIPVASGKAAEMYREEAAQPYTWK